MSGPQALLDVARSQLGTAENPPFSNIVKYSQWFGMTGPWCDMFVSWCAAESGNADAIGRFAYTPSHEAWFRSKGREVPIREAQPGDILFFNFIGRTSHVGIVEANRGDGLITIEGNTNGSGSRDGGSVIRHFRSWASGIVSVHRPAYTDNEEIDMAAADDIKNGMLALYIKGALDEERTRAMIRRKFAKLFAKLDGTDAQLGSVEDELQAIKSAVTAKALKAAARLDLAEVDIEGAVQAEAEGLTLDDD